MGFVQNKNLFEPTIVGVGLLYYTLPDANRIKLYLYAIIDLLKLYLNFNTVGNKMNELENGF